jgi:hypothetical protein
MWMIPHFLDKMFTDVEVISLTRKPRFTLQEHFLVHISVTGPVSLMAIVQLEGLGKLKKEKKQRSHRESNSRPSGL